MTIDNWIGLAGLVITTLGFAFAIYTLSHMTKQTKEMIRQTGEMSAQTRQLQKSIRLETYQRVYEQMINIDLFFVEHPELKPYFYDNKTVDDKTLSDKLSSLAETLVDLFYNIYFQKEGMPRETWVGWELYIKRVVQSSPVLQQFVNQNQSWYTQEFIELLRANEQTKQGA